MTEQTSQIATVPDSDYVVFGGTGDLALRKIFPAFFWRFLDGQVTENFRLIIAAHHIVSRDDFAEKLRPNCEDAFTSGVANDDNFAAFIGLMNIIELDVVSGKGADNLAGLINEKISADRPCIYYLAVAPSLFGASCQLLQQADLVHPQSRLIVEKPLGHDGPSAKLINNEILSVFTEEQIYRIDHYLGKETVQNLMALRFANIIFESLWSNNHIDHVQITAAETVGVGQRAEYYDKYGAVRDMLQNHLLQLLCLVAMEPPSQFNASQVRDEKLRVLRALRPANSEDIVRGQYQGYEAELGRTSNTDTFVALKVFVDNWRWAGVPFYIRTGKKMAVRASEIIITFKRRPHDIFSTIGQSQKGDAPNRLVIRVQPQEGLRLQLTSKEPGPGGMRFFPSELNLSFGETFDQRLPDAYERLLMDTARGNQTLFMRLDEVLAAWQFIDPIIDMAKDTAPHLYREGTMGPADTLLAKAGRDWIDPSEDG